MIFSTDKQKIIKPDILQEFIFQFKRKKKMIKAQGYFDMQSLYLW